MLGDDSYFSDDFKELLNWMLQYLPKNRPTLQQIRSHKYLRQNEDMADIKEVGLHFILLRSDVEKGHKK